MWVLYHWATWEASGGDRESFPGERFFGDLVEPGAGQSESAGNGWVAEVHGGEVMHILKGHGDRGDKTASLSPQTK